MYLWTKQFSPAAPCHRVWALRLKLYNFNLPLNIYNLLLSWIRYVYLHVISKVSSLSLWMESVITSQIYNIDIFGRQSHQPEAKWWDLNCFEIDSTLELSVNISLYDGGLWWISNYVGEIMLAQTDTNWQQLRIWWRFNCSAAVGACTAAWQNITGHLNKKKQTPSCVSLNLANQDKRHLMDN